MLAHNTRYSYYLSYIAIKGNNGSQIWMNKIILVILSIFFLEIILPNDNNFENYTIFTIQEGWHLEAYGTSLSCFCKGLGGPSSALWAPQLSKLL